MTNPFDQFDQSGGIPELGARRARFPEQARTALAQRPGNPFDQFDGATHVEQKTLDAEPQAPNTDVDVARSIPGGLAQGGAMSLGLPGDVFQMGQRIGRYITGSDAKPVPLPGSPTTGDIDAQISGPFGGYYEPKTKAGEYAETIASMWPAALSPGGPVARAARVIVPGASSQLGGDIGQAVGGDTGEGYGRAIGALAGGVAQGGAEAVRASRSASAAIPTTAQIKTAGGATFKSVADVPVDVTPEMADAIGGVSGRAAITRALERAEANREVKLTNELKSLLTDDPTKLPTQISAEAADKVSRAFRKLGMNETLTPTGDKDIARGMFGRRADVETALTSVPEIKEARQIWSRYERSKILDQTMEAAHNNSSTPAGGMGLEPSIRKEFGKLVRNKRLMEGFSAAERDAIKRVNNGTLTANILQRIGKFSPLRNHLTGILELGAAVGGGAAFGGVGAVPAIGLAAVGVGAAQGAKLATMRSANRASELVRSGAPRAALDLSRPGYSSAISGALARPGSSANDNYGAQIRSLSQIP